MISTNCSNCGKTNHSIKSCDEPITSVGIVCFKLNQSLYNIFIQNLQYISYYDMNNIVLDNINKFNKYNDNIEFLLVKRRNSLNYIDFIRGKYDIVNKEHIINMCSYMSKDEIKLIQTKDFTYLWNNLWLKNANKKKYLEEMNLSKIKFNHLKITNFFNKINSIYETTEWEIPKGKKKQNETNLNCAIREFKEETTINNTDYTILNCLDPIHDLFIGTNSKPYRHIFYNSIIRPDIDDIEYSNNEIDMVQWCKWSELNDYIRPYNSSKINILTSIFLFIINICEDNQFKNKTGFNINVDL
jgi:hypothetical protein